MYDVMQYYRKWFYGSSYHMLWFVLLICWEEHLAKWLLIKQVCHLPSLVSHVWLDPVLCSHAWSRLGVSQLAGLCLTWTGGLIRQHPRLHHNCQWNPIQVDVFLSQHANLIKIPTFNQHIFLLIQFPKMYQISLINIYILNYLQDTNENKSFQ